MNKEELTKRGYEAYDFGRSKEQAEQIAEGIKTAFEQVEIIPTTNEADQKSCPFIIYVNHNSAI